MGEISSLYKGFQTVIPSKIRKALNLDLDYVIEWNIGEDGKVVLDFRKKTNFMDLQGIVSSKDSTDSVELQRKMRRGEELDFS
ncbi:MAG: type II toxin-antitoxin system PrlF family antitoxin [Clostridioides sp.]|jgi:bifunctional DNA-binding transcriptional regulator/antitoxin component of YhaV-PrlF toxin-antitoxin module|nr:type II toxin-antitoxin system PrlF family antitoxin [Clostridioides sp.]